MNVATIGFKPTRNTFAFTVRANRGKILQPADLDTSIGLQAILDGESISDAAVWLDRVRENFQFSKLTDTQEANQFKRDFP